MDSPPSASQRATHGPTPNAPQRPVSFANRIEGRPARRLNLERTLANIIVHRIPDVPDVAPLPLDLAPHAVPDPIPSSIDDEYDDGSSPIYDNPTVPPRPLPIRPLRIASRSTERSTRGAPLPESSSEIEMAFRKLNELVANSRSGRNAIGHLLRHFREMRRGDRNIMQCFARVCEENATLERNSANSANSPNEEFVVSAKCVICMNAIANSICLPCGHLVSCSNCTQMLMQACEPGTTASCPKCRMPNVRMQRIFFP